jgi:hypothetical protein
VLGLRAPLDRYVSRTQPEGARSGPGDTDLVMYSLRRYLRLATKGNPTALLPLFAPSSSVLATTQLGDELRALRSAFLSRQAAQRFLGYLDGQRERMLGLHRGAPHRPELVARHGYDTKYASHALRLAYQGLEIVQHARLTLPMPEPERARVRQVKRGEVPDQAEVLAEVATVRSQIESRLANDDTPLPAQPDVDAVSAWSVHAHCAHWGWHRS